MPISFGHCFPQYDNKQLRLTMFAECTTTLDGHHVGLKVNITDAQQLNKQIND